ncbi:hypothetical protein DCS_04240 [Drechmeria coniospora]|uniref:rRNA N-glycosylase n=1 Tax=Drechmeria coniospora TaxID=98403 RepID=A0A151GJC8_DRECN|nr:hypothetical protein DCS_04240 [Drechmeria coniospora]KYK57233.1 hypothetical protein DCS_04240 [Drechmeria coniospora]
MIIYQTRLLLFGLVASVAVAIPRARLAPLPTGPQSSVDLHKVQLISDIAIGPQSLPVTQIAPQDRKVEPRLPFLSNDLQKRDDTLLKFDLDVSRAEAKEYSTFIEDFRTAIKNENPTVAGHIPVLPSGDKSCFEVKLYSANGPIVTLRLQKNNLYLVGYGVEMGNSETWFRFQNEAGKGLGDTDLRFTGDYPQLEKYGADINRNGQEYYRTSKLLTQADLQNAVMELSKGSLKDKSKLARSLLVIIEMVPESIRCKAVTKYIENVWDGYEMSNRIIKMRNQVADLETNWDSISAAVTDPTRDRKSLIAKFGAGFNPEKVLGVAKSQDSFYKAGIGRDSKNKGNCKRGMGSCIARKQSKQEQAQATEEHVQSTVKQAQSNSNSKSNNNQADAFSKTGTMYRGEGTRVKVSGLNNICKRRGGIGVGSGHSSGHGSAGHGAGHSAGHVGGGRRVQGKANTVSQRFKDQRFRDHFMCNGIPEIGDHQLEEGAETIVDNLKPKTGQEGSTGNATTTFVATTNSQGTNTSLSLSGQWTIDFFICFLRPEDFAFRDQVFFSGKRTMREASGQLVICDKSIRSNCYYPTALQGWTPKVAIRVNRDTTGGQNTTLETGSEDTINIHSNELATIVRPETFVEKLEQDKSAFRLESGQLVICNNKGKNCSAAHSDDAFIEEGVKSNLATVVPPESFVFGLEKGKVAFRQPSGQLVICNEQFQACFAPSVGDGRPSSGATEVVRPSSEATDRGHLSSEATEKERHSS